MTVTAFPNGISDAPGQVARAGLAMVGISHHNLIEDFDTWVEVDESVGGDSYYLGILPWEILTGTGSVLAPTNIHGIGGWLSIDSGTTAASVTQILRPNNTIVGGVGGSWALAMRFYRQLYSTETEQFLGLTSAFTLATGALDFDNISCVGLHHAGDAEADSWEFVVNNLGTEERVAVQIDPTTYYDVAIMHDGADGYALYLNGNRVAEITSSALGSVLMRMGCFAGNNGVGLSSAGFDIDYIAISAQRVNL